MRRRTSKGLCASSTTKALPVRRRGGGCDFLARSPASSAASSRFTQTGACRGVPADFFFFFFFFSSLGGRERGPRRCRFLRLARLSSRNLLLQVAGPLLRRLAAAACVAAARAAESARAASPRQSAAARFCGSRSRDFGKLFA